MKEVSAYKCDFCHKCFGRKVNAIQHENKCKNNPKSRNCRTCTHGVSAIVCHSKDYTFLEEEYETTPVYGPWCDEFEMPIHEKPYLEECEFGDDYQETPIPFTCMRYEYKGYAGFRRIE